MSRPSIDQELFTAWLDRLAGSRPPRGAAGLNHARAFFDVLDNPQNFAPAVHIVGTAGKGTIAHLLTKRFTNRSMIVGTHMSPHVYDVRERFLLGGELPEWDLVLGAAEDVVSAAERVETITGRPPSFFAATAAMSWVVARRANADMLVVEAGIGGRYDATNVFERPDRVVVVTRIGIDHADVLGETAVEIATEKAAVIQGSAAVVLAPQSQADVEAEVMDAARSAGVDVVKVECPPGGDWRAESAATAAAVEDLILGNSAPVGPSTVLPPGRMERIQVENRTFILDGAHNATKLAGLAESMRRDHPSGVNCVVAAIGRHKHLESCAEVLAAISPLAVVTSFASGSTKTDPVPQSWPADDLARAIADSPAAPRVVQSLDVIEAIEAAWANTSEGNVVLVTGSFLYLADARRAILKVADALRR